MDISSEVIVHTALYSIFEPIKEKLLAQRYISIRRHSRGILGLNTKHL